MAKIPQHCSRDAEVCLCLVISWFFFGWWHLSKFQGDFAPPGWLRFFRQIMDFIETFSSCPTPTCSVYPGAPKVTCTSIFFFPLSPNTSVLEQGSFSAVLLDFRYPNISWVDYFHQWYCRQWYWTFQKMFDLKTWTLGSDTCSGVECANSAAIV